MADEVCREGGAVGLDGAVDDGASVKGTVRGTSSSSGGGGSKGGGSKKEMSELRRCYERKMRDARAEYDAGIEKLRREHQTEIGKLREARETRYAEYERRLTDAMREINNLRGLLAMHKVNVEAGDNMEEDVDGARTPPGVVSENLPAKVMELQQKVQSLQEELEYSNQLFHDLSLYTNGVKAQINHAKDVLVSMGAVSFPEILPTYTFCEATPEEVESALLAGREAERGKGSVLEELEEVDVGDALAEETGDENRPPVTHAHPHPTYGGIDSHKVYLVPIKMLDKALEEVDQAVRDQRFDPFKRKDGEVAEVDWSDERLRTLESTYGRPLAELVVKKKMEVEKYCPSGGYPTPVLYEDGRELSIGECIVRLIQELRRKSGIKPNETRAVVFTSGPNAYLQLDPSTRETLPYLTRHTVAHTATHTATQNTHECVGPLPDAIGHVFVRWLKVHKEIREHPNGWGYFRVANKALAGAMRPHERVGRSEEQVRRWVDTRRDAIEKLCPTLDRPTRVAVRAFLHFFETRQPGYFTQPKKHTHAHTHSHTHAHTMSSSSSFVPSSALAEGPGKQPLTKGAKVGTKNDNGSSIKIEHEESVHGDVLRVLSGFLTNGRRMAESMVARYVRDAAPMVDMIMRKGDRGVQSFSERVMEQLRDLEAIRESMDTPSQRRTLKEVVRFGLAVHALNAQGEDPEKKWGADVYTPHGDGRKGGLGKEVRDAFEAWLAETQDNIPEPDQARATVREACKLVREVAVVCEPTKVPKAIKTRDEVKQLCSRAVCAMEASMRDGSKAKRKAGELLWEFLMGEAKEWPTYQGPEGMSLCGWETSDDDDDDGNEEEDHQEEDAGAAGGGPSPPPSSATHIAVTSSSSSSPPPPSSSSSSSAARTHTHAHTAHPPHTHTCSVDDHLTAVGVSAEVTREVRVALDKIKGKDASRLDRMMAECASLITTAQQEPHTDAHTHTHAHTAAADTQTTSPSSTKDHARSRAINTRAELKAVLGPCRTHIANVMTSSTDTTRKQAIRTLVKFAGLRSILQDMKAPSPAVTTAKPDAAPSTQPATSKIPPLPEALVGRFWDYLVKKERLAYPPPYVEALSSLYHKLMERKLQEGKCEAANACLKAAKTSDGVSERELDIFLQACKDVVRSAHITQHLEKEAYRYWNGWMIETLAQLYQNPKKRTANAAGITNVTTQGADDSTGEDAVKKLRGKDCEWRSLSDAVVREFGTWLEATKGRELSSISESAMTCVDDMLKTLVMKNNTLFSRGDIRWLVKGYPAHLKRLASREPPQHQRAYELFREFVLSEE